MLSIPFTPTRASLRVVARAVILFAGLLFGAEPNQGLRLVATGETHAMIDACDCPVNPGGGFARRAWLLDSLRAISQPLLLDAGGFCGGGIYDEYTEGRSGDSLRTLLTLAAMGSMRYDAATVGDDELQYNPQWLAERAAAAKVPLVSANIEAFGRRVFSPYIIVVREGVRIAITGVCTTEKLMNRDPCAKVVDPVTSLKKIWKEMLDRSDYQIILSHLGEEQSLALIDAFPACDVLFNGHRKSSTDAVIVKGAVPLAQFGFQGKALTSLRMTPGVLGLSLKEHDWIAISPAVPSDSAMTNLIRSFRAMRQAPPQAVYDLYIMSKCPYGIPALKELVDFCDNAPGTAWNVWFVGSIAGDTSLSSLHGSDEVADEVTWLSIEALYPSRWHEFVVRRTATGQPTDTVVRSMGLSTDSLQQWARAHGRAELTVHYRRSERLGITASPTLLVNNVPYEEEITSLRLARGQCDRGGTLRDHGCDSLPECIRNADCRRNGFEGTCDAEKGRCHFAKAPGFTLTIVRAPRSITHPEFEVIGKTSDLFPGVVIDTVSSDSKRGRELIRRYHATVLPLYLFDQKVLQTGNYAAIASGLSRVGDRLTFKNGMFRANYMLTRPMRAGDLAVYIDPVFSGAGDAVKQCLADTGALRIEPACADTEQDDDTIANAFRMQESLRWLVLQKFFPGKFRDYLKTFAGAAGSFSWGRAAALAGVDPEKLAIQCDSSASLLADQIAAVRSLWIDGPITALIDNTELVPVANKQIMAELLKRSAQ
jgi:hypothetical protein